MNLSNRVNKPAEAHSVTEFVTVGKLLSNKDQITDFSFMESIDGQEYIVYNILDTYFPTLKESTMKVYLTKSEQALYKFNPKLLSYKLYNNPNYYWIILRLNDMIDVHEFDLNKGYINLLTPSDLSASLKSILRKEQKAMYKYNTAHKDTKRITKIDKYR